MQGSDMESHSGYEDHFFKPTKPTVPYKPENPLFKDDIEKASSLNIYTGEAIKP